MLVEPRGVSTRPRLGREWSDELDDAVQGRHRTPGSLQTPFAETVTDYGERVVVSTEISVQYLPLQGTQDGTFVTTRDPASRALGSRVESLQCP